MCSVPSPFGRKSIATQHNCQQSLYNWINRSGAARRQPPTITVSTSTVDGRTRDDLEDSRQPSLDPCISAESSYHHLHVRAFSDDSPHLDGGRRNEDSGVTGSHAQSLDFMHDQGWRSDLLQRVEADDGPADCLSRPERLPRVAALARRRIIAMIRPPAAKPASIVGAMKAMAGASPKDRASFAKGRCVRGTYIPSDRADEVTKSQSFTRPSRVLARFSVDGGDVDVTDIKNRVLRGFSFRLGEDDHRSDILTHSAPVHFARTLDRMLAFLKPRCHLPSGRRPKYLTSGHSAMGHPVRPVLSIEQGALWHLPGRLCRSPR